MQADFSNPPTPTNLVIAYNVIGDDQCYNQSYQAGISQQGHTDYMLLSNYIAQGGGYGPSCGPDIDVIGGTAGPCSAGTSRRATSGPCSRVPGP